MDILDFTKKFPNDQSCIIYFKETHENEGDLPIEKRCSKYLNFASAGSATAYINTTLLNEKIS